MVNEFSMIEHRMMQSLLSKKSYEEIAMLMDRPLHDVEEKINTYIHGKDIITYQQRMDKAPKSKLQIRSEKKTKEDRKKAIAKEQKRQRMARDNELTQNRKRRQEPLFKTKQVDYSQMISVRIDHKTVLQVPKGTDVSALKEKYLRRIQESKPIAPAERSATKIKKVKPIS